MAASQGTFVNSKVYQTFTTYNIHHYLLWIIYFLFWVYVISPGVEQVDYFINSAVIVAVHILVSYFNIYYLFPTYLQRRNYLQFVLAIILSISLGTFIEAGIFLSLDTIALEEKSGLLAPRFLLTTAMAITYTVAITMCLKLVKHWYEKERLARELTKLNTETELKYLKSQINPHFLFNSLNSIYALSLQKSDLAPDLILKLSDILRYILYEGSEKKVSLAQEVKYLKSYLELEKVRHGKRMELTLNIEGDTEAQEIAPMLLIPFVENSFKHGLSKDVSGGYVRASLTTNKQHIHFEIINSKPLNGSEIKKNKNYKGGIGLANVKKRLNLLYPNKYKLAIGETQKEFKVELDIQVN